MSSTATPALHSVRVNFWTHLIFPARTLYKDMAYWPTEIAAGIIMFIFILQMKLVEVTKPDGNKTHVYESDTTVPRSLYGIAGDKTPGYQSYPTELLNQEYAWICLCYAIKHFVYLLDTAMLLKNKIGKITDIIPPVLNLGIWVLWGIYGWAYAGDQIHAGQYIRLQLDTIDIGSKALGAAGIPGGVDFFATARTEADNWYDANQAWKWLYIPTGIVTVVLFVLWCLNLGLKRSSAYTNVAMSTWLITLQLFFLSLFFKGWWIKSNAQKYADDKIANKEPESNPDYFEARYVFVIIYFASWVGLLFAVICIFKSILDMRYHLTNFFKFNMYALFWASAFLWCLCMDATLYQPMIDFRVGLIITMIVCLVTALLIGIVSIMQKKKEVDDFWKRHENYYAWNTDVAYFN